MQTNQIKERNDQSQLILMEIAPRKPWISEALIKKMEKRRIAKTTNANEYRSLNNQLRETDRAKEVYMQEICEEERQI